MTQISQDLSPAPGSALQPVADFAALLMSGALEMQRLQVEWLSTWYGNTAAMQRELWDAWTSHFAGGVPIDG